jgi:hypothetical protein
MISTQSRGPDVLPDLFCDKVQYESGPDKLGLLRDSGDLRDDPAALRQRMAEDGYLFIRGLLGRGDVLDARRAVTNRLAECGMLQAGTDPMDAIAVPQEELLNSMLRGAEANRITLDLASHKTVEERRAQAARHTSFMPELLAKDNLAIQHVLYGEKMMGFFDRFFGEPAKHFDFTWFRSMVPGGRGTYPHCDVVYMGRAETEQLFTVWTPMGDIPFEVGGLVVLEGSNRNVALRAAVSRRDVDSFCENREDKRDEWQRNLNGELSRDVVRVRRSLGGRWLTAEYEAGDALIFSVFTVHASMDNHSDQIRLSADSRYQPASKPADERWVGANPPGHGPASKRGLIC